MRAGELRHRVTIEKPVKSKDDFNYGEQVTEWEIFKSNVAAAIWPLKGKEYISAQQVQSSITHKVRTRYIKGVTPEFRIKFRDRYLYVRVPINPDERNIMLEMMCEEKHGG